MTYDIMFTCKIAVSSAYLRNTENYKTIAY